MNPGFSSPFIYVSRKQSELIEKLVSARISDVAFIPRNNEHPKYREYLVTKITDKGGVDEARQRLSGVHGAISNGRPINHLTIVWKGKRPPPRQFHFFSLLHEPSFINEWKSAVLWSVYKEKDLKRT